jgi:hypothetical protein
LLEVVKESQEASTIGEQHAEPKRKLTVSVEDALIEKLLKHVDKNLTYCQIVKDNTKQDVGKLFLMSLNDDFKKISVQYKWDVKSEIIGLIKKYKRLCPCRQQAYMHPQQNYTGYNTVSFSWGYHEPPPQLRIIGICKVFLMFIVVTCHLLQPKTTCLWDSLHQLLTACHAILF